MASKKIAKQLAKGPKRLAVSGGVAVAEGFLSDLVPGSSVAVLYREDDVWNERVVLWPGEDAETFYLLSPDGDISEESLALDAEDDAIRIALMGKDGRTPAVCKGHFYRFKEYDDLEDFKGRVQEASDALEADHKGVKVKVPTQFLDPTDGTLRPLKDLLGDAMPRATPKSAMKKAGTQVVAADVDKKGDDKKQDDEPDGQGTPRRRVTGKSKRLSGVGESLEWVITELGKKNELGKIIDEQADHVKVFDKVGFCEVDGAWLKVEKLAVNRIPERIEEIKTQWRTALALEKKADTGAAAATPDDPDARILPVKFDSAEERWRTIEEAAPLLYEEEFYDVPLTGPRTVMATIRGLRRAGHTFLQHHEGWVRRSGVRMNDRRVHEHLSVCRALHLLTCYDQLCVSNLAGAETLNRRRALIEQAHQQRPEAPIFESAEAFMGTREPADGTLIDDQLARHVAAREHAKAEILRQQRLTREEQRNRQNLGGGGGDPKGGNPKGGGRGKGDQGAHGGAKEPP